MEEKSRISWRLGTEMGTVRWLKDCYDHLIKQKLSVPAACSVL